LFFVVTVVDLLISALGRYKYSAIVTKYVVEIIIWSKEIYNNNNKEIYNNTNDILACEKDSVKYFPSNVSYEWRVNLLKELLAIKRNPHHLEGFSLEEVEFFYRKFGLLLILLRIINLSTVLYKCRVIYCYISKCL